MLVVKIKTVPMNSRYYMLSCELGFGSPTLYLPMLPHLSMLFILALALPANQCQLRASSRINRILRHAEYVETGARNLELGSLDIVLCTRHDDSSFVAVPRILMK